VIAGSLTASLLLMPGWKSSLALFAVYAAILGYVSLSPQMIEGQMERATRGPAGSRWPSRPSCGPRYFS
ncbi:MAG: hypothetical protein ABIY37_07345, partial [Devosia sp.]